MAISRSASFGVLRSVARLGLPAALALVLLGNSDLPAADAAPTVISVWPEANATGVPLKSATDGSLAVSFSEPVSLGVGALEVACERSGRHELTISGGPVSFSFVSDRSFLPGETCMATVQAELVSDLDVDDPPDLMSNLVFWSFRAGAEPVVINELDAISADEWGEFVELYDGGRGDTALDGLSLVIYGLKGTLAYLAVSLDGYRTNEAGYFLLGDGGIEGVDLRVANGIFLDEAGAVAIYDSPPDGFKGFPPPTRETVDAVVYGAAAPELLALLRPGEMPLDENGLGTAISDSSQRCPDGAEPPQSTAAFIIATSTPGEPNDCPVDDPPEVITVTPAPDALDVPLEATIGIEFSEPVTLADDAVEISCTVSGLHAYTVAGGGQSFQFAPDQPFVARESCLITIFAERVTDADGDDPPDHPTIDYFWNIATIRPVAGNVLINEVDADTPGVDTAEFIELYDGGQGHTALDGLSLVLFNGQDDRSYLTLELDGYSTDEAGYFLVGNASVAGVELVFADGALQNGPDAIALVAGDGLDYPDGTTVTDTVPIDALVYGRVTQADSTLLSLLEPGQTSVDESGRDDARRHSNQRCPNGSGGLRMTAGYKQNIPTPGANNNCITDEAPAVKSFSPIDNAADVGIGGALTIEFTEPVALAEGWLDLTCDSSGVHAYQTSGGSSFFTIEAILPFHYSEGCSAAIHAGLVTDLDSDDPPDEMAKDISWRFTTTPKPADFVMINEIDADTPGSDKAEFIELYDGGIGNTKFDGLALVFFNGKDARSYRAIDLDGRWTNARGYFVIGNAAVNPDLVLPNGALQNGPDAVALYIADAAQFPLGTSPRQSGLLDAIVYGEKDDVSSTLLELLLSGQSPVDENSRGAGDLHSLQRCPNGAGGQRQTTSYIANRPTPGAVNNCTIDEPPSVTQIQPADGATGVELGATIQISFSESVNTETGWVTVVCSESGIHEFDATGGPKKITLTPRMPFEYDERCEVTLLAAKVTDADSDDPPDRMATDFKGTFQTVLPPPAADFVMINEIDADTSGSDTTEFIELYDGGIGRTKLDGLALVFFNGKDDRSYRAIDLDGRRTNDRGYFVIGNAAVNPDLVLPNGALQNGPDAVALYIADAAHFPSGTSPRQSGLLDAIVYGEKDDVSSTLLALLLSGQSPVDENSRGAGDLHSLQRCPNGAGGQRQTTSYIANRPTPGAVNNCTIDEPPSVTQIQPANNATGVELGATIQISFSEGVITETGWATIVCSESGPHEFDTTGGPKKITLTPRIPFEYDERCEVTLLAAKVTDADSDDPPDRMATDFKGTFQTVLPPPAADFVMINEIDADTPGSDKAQFIELYDGGIGQTKLDGLVVVFWNGGDGKSYRVFNLLGFQTDSNGYFLLGNAAVANADLIYADGELQNGPDAVSLHAGRPSGFSSGTPLKIGGLIDAVVYGSPGQANPRLSALLEAGQPQRDEAGRGDGLIHSLQRCPNGAGGMRRTEAYWPDLPTPGAANLCRRDEPPVVVSHDPSENAVDILPNSSIEVSFSEDVVLDDGWLTVECGVSGRHTAVVEDGPRIWRITPDMPFAAGESCEVRLGADAIHDTDRDDPPDNPPEDFVWGFRIMPLPTIIFTTNSPIWIGQTAVFNSTINGSGPLDVKWEFGDDRRSTEGSGASHNYTATGSYIVRLTVTNPAGAVSRSQRMIVRPRMIYFPVFPLSGNR